MEIVDRIVTLMSDEYKLKRKIVVHCRLIIKFTIKF
jgi:hypothetical protein